MCQARHCPFLTAVGSAFRPTSIVISSPQYLSYIHTYFIIRKSRRASECTHCRFFFHGAFFLLLSLSPQQKITSITTTVYCIHTSAYRRVGHGKESTNKLEAHTHTQQCTAVLYYSPHVPMFVSCFISTATEAVDTSTCQCAHPQPALLDDVFQLGPPAKYFHHQ